MESANRRQVRITQIVLSPSMDRQAAESNRSSGSRGPHVLSSCNSGDIETIIAWYEPRTRLVSRAAYAGAYAKGENSPYLPLWSYASPSSVTRYVLVAHNSCVLDVKPVGL